ncbi:MAG: response regulator, partial [Gammaproteobacteria bacterium]
MSQSKVLVIDGDAARADQIKSLLEFIDYEALRAEPSDAVQVLADGIQVLAVILGAAGSDAEQKRLVKELRKHDSGLPVLLLVDKDAAPLSA